MHYPFLLLPLLLLLSQPVHASAEALKAGDTVYLKVNVWYDDDHRILSTNYHSGNIVPAGTEVMITEFTGDTIRFELRDNRNPYFILNVRRHSMNATMDDLTGWYFSRDNPLDPGGPFSQFTEEEQRNIRLGTVHEGMSRDAVLKAYGYPPRYQTSSLKNNLWVYWDTRWKKKIIYFEEDRVSRIFNSEDR